MPCRGVSVGVCALADGGSLQDTGWVPRCREEQCQPCRDLPRREGPGHLPQPPPDLAVCPLSGPHWPPGMQGCGSVDPGRSPRGSGSRTELLALSQGPPDPRLVRVVRPHSVVEARTPMWGTNCSPTTQTPSGPCVLLPGTRASGLRRFPGSAPAYWSRGLEQRQCGALWPLWAPGRW